MIVEWDVPFELISSVNLADTAPGLSPLLFNDLVHLDGNPLGNYFLDPSKCQAGAARRITRNNLAQADGEITHRKFKSGYVVELNAQLWETKDAPACAGTLREMADLLEGYLEAISNADGQLVWHPSAWPEGGTAPKPRLLDRARSMGPSGNDAGGSSFVSVVTEKDSESPLTVVTFALLSPLPYATDFMDYPTTPDATVPLVVDAPDFLTATITNEGNVDYHPLVRVHGPSVGFALMNNSVVDEAGKVLTIIYDSTLPGAFPIPSGGYVEIDMFTWRVQVFNPGGGTDNARSCIDVLNSDLWTLPPGANDIGLLYFASAGAGAEVVYRNAWA